MYSSNRPTTSSLQRKRRSPCSILAESELVPHIVESVQIESVQTTEFAHPFTNDSPGSNMGRHKIMEPLQLTSIVKGFLKDKVSDDTISIVKKAHADSSLRHYQAIWGKFLGFLDANSNSHDSVGIADVMNFYLIMQFNLKKGSFVQLLLISVLSRFLSNWYSELTLEAQN